MASFPERETGRQGDKETAAAVFSLSPCLLVFWLATITLTLALALLPLQTILLALGAALALTLPLLDPIFGVYWAILSIPAQEVVHLPGGLSYTQAAMLVAAAGWALRALAHPERQLLARRDRHVSAQLFL